jgi:hypothetical protein
MPYIPDINGRTVRTLADWGQFYKANGQPYDIIELVDEENTILDDADWAEATDEDGNRTAVRTDLPKVHRRRLYKGVPVSKSSVSIIKDPVAMFEGHSLIDAKMFELHRDKVAAYRMQEARSFTESMRQELSTAFFYGSVKNEPDTIHGLDPRYAYKDAPNVIDAGGSGNQCTSVYGVVWGQREVSGIFPKGSIAGLQHEDMGKGMATDPDGNEFIAVRDVYTWNAGLAVSDWRCVVRICNIDVTKLNLGKNDPGFVDLNALTIRAKNMIPPEKLPRMKWYMNRDVQTALELQAYSDRGHVVFVRTEQTDRKPTGTGADGNPIYSSYPVANVHYCPVRRNDAILSTEEALVAAPVSV